MTDSNVRVLYFVKIKCSCNDEVVWRMSGLILSHACSSNFLFFYLNPVGGRSQQISRYLTWHEGIFVTECHVFANQYWQELIEQGRLYLPIFLVDKYFFKLHPANIYMHK